MNGRYLVASGGNQGVHFNDDYKSKGHEYFDVYSPEIATHYGEVFWTDLGNNPIPKEIIDRFAGILCIIYYNFENPLDLNNIMPLLPTFFLFEPILVIVCKLTTEMGSSWRLLNFQMFELRVLGELGRIQDIWKEGDLFWKNKDKNELFQI